MHLLPRHIKLDLINQRQKAFIFSGALLAVMLISLLVRGLNFGIDFTGGTLVGVEYSQPVLVGKVREDLSAAGFAQAVVQTFGSPREILVRVPTTRDQDSAAVSSAILEALRTGASEGLSVTMRRVEFVGAQVGEELTRKGLLALLYALVGILIYIAWRFELRFAGAGIAALVHDVLITVGVFSLTGMEFDLTVVAAILAVIGYSLNDTIVVFDRIRENLRKMRRADTAWVMNESINETLARTTVTSLTTLLVLFSLFILGGPVIHGFATALIIGVLIGTYSSVFVGAPLALVFGVTRTTLMAGPVSEGPRSKETQEDMGGRAES